jgi:hypothetical protein
MINSRTIDIGANGVVYCHPRSIVPINAPWAETQEQDSNGQENRLSRRDPADSLVGSDWMDSET